MTSLRATDITADFCLRVKNANSKKIAKFIILENLHKLNNFETKKL